MTCICRKVSSSEFFSPSHVISFQVFSAQSVQSSGWGWSHTVPPGLQFGINGTSRSPRWTGTSSLHIYIKPCPLFKRGKAACKASFISNHQHFFPSPLFLFVSRWLLGVSLMSWQSMSVWRGYGRRLHSIATTSYPRSCLTILLVERLLRAAKLAQ